MNSNYTYKHKQLTNGVQLYLYSQVDSTNQEALRLAQSCETPEIFDQGVLLVSSSQTAGRGQYDREWLSEKGGLYYTLMISEPPLALADTQKIHQRATIIGNSVIRSIKRNINIPLEIKPPNDILLAGKKMGGILIETTQCQDQHITIIGIGLNIAQKAFPTDLKFKAISIGQLYDEPIDKQKLIINLTEELLRTIKSKQAT